MDFGRVAVEPDPDLRRTTDQGALLRQSLGEPGLVAMVIGVLTDGSR